MKLKILENPSWSISSTSKLYVPIGKLSGIVKTPELIAVIAVVVPVPPLLHLSRYSASLTGNVARPSRPTYICLRHLGNVTIARFLAKLKSIQFGAPVRRSEHCQKGLQTFKWLYVLSAHAQLRIMENKTIQSLINNQNKANI